MKRLLPLLLALGCASAQPTHPPQWTELPPLVLDAFCASLRLEAMGKDTPIVVVRLTEPLITTNSMRALGDAYFKGGVPAQYARSLNEVLHPMPVSVPTGNCAWQPVDRFDTQRHGDAWILQLSDAFVNPYARGEAGLFGRLTVGGHDPQWYWLPLAEQKGVWAAGRVAALDLRD